MKIIADQNIPEVEAAFQSLGNVELIPGRDITRTQLLDCQCLLVRTVTTIDKSLLHDTPVQFVASATIGTDHIDLDYLKHQGITFSNAAGCNAEAAAEYVISGIFALSQHLDFDPFSRKAGIIGCGNVGSNLLKKFQTLGIETLVCDPPRAELERDNSSYVDLDTLIAECDLISLHVPLTRKGKHATHHLFNQKNLASLNKGCLLINAARGSVVDNQALDAVLTLRPDLMTFLDTWENEPNLLRTLLEKVDLATPHIAGYSVEGRLRGTQMILDAACGFFGQQARWRYDLNLPTTILLDTPTSHHKLEFFQQIFEHHHAIWQDHLALKNTGALTDIEFAHHFDSLRRIYPQRFEYERYQLNAKNDSDSLRIARALGFN